MAHNAPIHAPERRAKHLGTAGIMLELNQRTEARRKQADRVATVSPGRRVVVPVASGIAGECPAITLVGSSR
jgi:hypothetical protein